MATAMATNSVYMEKFCGGIAGRSTEGEGATRYGLHAAANHAIRRRVSTGMLCAIAALASTLGQAQTPDMPRAEVVTPSTAWRFTPEISVTDTYTDNASLAPSVLAQKSWVTEATPGLRVEKLGVRSKLYLDYRLHDFRYSGNSRLNNSQRLLTSYATVEAIDNWLFVDASASITQQNRSAFSIAGATNATGANGNRVETATNQISPYTRGKVADIAAYQLRFLAADIRANDAALPDTRGKQWTSFIKNQRAISGFGWSIDGNALSFRNDVTGKSYDERIRGTLSYELDPQIHVSAIGGREVTNFAGVQNDKATTSGFGVEWSPDARTQFAAVKERRFFGNGQSISLKHRTALSAWSFTSTRDISAPSGQLLSAGSGSTAGLLSDLLAASIPDPVARDAAVRQRLEDAGLPAGSAAGSGFATARPSLIRNTEASVALRGVYNTVTLSVTRSDQRGLGSTVAGNADSFSLSNEIRQQGVNLNWAYRLSPLSSVSFVATSLRSEGLATTGLDSSQRSLNALLSTRLGLHTYATFGARRVHFDNSSNTGYWENAVLGSVSLRY
jgi:uncharacterized protein (PEP-CTERM system associated)